MYMGMRMFRALALATAVIALTACAGRQPKATASPAVQPVAKSADYQGNRFYMTQNGRRMTADDFDAWLKAKGLRIQGGKVVRSAAGPKPAAKVARTARDKSAAGVARASAAPGTGATVRASTTSKVAGAAKPKPKAKPKKAAVAATAVVTHGDG